MKNNYLIITAMALALAAIFSSCERTLDEPPLNQIPEGNVLTIGDLQQIFQDSGTYKFTEDFSIFATVTADKVGGNFYKSVFIQDSTSALNMRTIANGGVYIGDRIRVNLNGSTISEYAELLQLDSVDVDKQVVIQANGEYEEPAVITMSQALSDDYYVGRLVTIEDVEFVDGDLGASYADVNGTSAQNRYLQDCSGNEVIVRTSDFSSFAAQLVPGGSGSVTAILSRFNDDRQLLLRRVSEVNLPELRCDGSTGEYILFKNFEDLSITSGGWSNYIVVGSDDWFIDEFSGNNFAKATNWTGSANDPSDVWLLSPAINLTETTSPALSFLSIANYDGPDMEVFVSTDYNGGDPNSATWNVLSANLSPGGWEETVSGTIDLSPYISANTRIGFRYTGSASDGATWELDNIAIFEN